LLGFFGFTGAGVDGLSVARGASVRLLLGGDTAALAVSPTAAVGA
jgi:hypothetical protein